VAFVNHDRRIVSWFFRKSWRGAWINFLKSDKSKWRSLPWPEFLGKTELYEAALWEVAGFAKQPVKSLLTVKIVFFVSLQKVRNKKPPSKEFRCIYTYTPLKSTARVFLCLRSFTRIHIFR
jgi:hypothetical protein